MSQNSDTEEQGASSLTSDASGTDVIDKALLEKAFREAENRDDITIDHFSVSKGSTFGDGFMSTVWSVQVQAQYGSDSRTVPVIVKIMADNPAIKDLALNAGLFKKEVGFYDTVLPSLIKFQQSRQVSPRMPSVPKFYFGFENTTNKIGVVVMEDLRDSGYKMVNIKEGLDYDHCRLVVVELANLHALSFALKSEQENFIEKEFGELLDDPMLSDHIEAAFNYEEILRAALGKALGFFNTLDTVDENVKSKVKVMFDEIIESGVHQNVIKKYLTLPTKPYGVICHGDTWSNNMMFRYGSSDVGSPEKPVQVKLLDLQCIRYALPTTDLSLFLFTSAKPNVRRKHLKDLLKLYHKTFTETLRHVKAPYPEFTFEVFYEMFVNTAICGVVMACDILHGVLADDDVIRDLERTETSDQFADFIHKMSSKSSGAVLAIMKDRMGSIIEDYLSLID